MPSPERRALVRDAILLAAATIVARALFLWLLPDKAYSIDLRGSVGIAAALSRGENPYAVTDYLHYPPLWMQIVYVLAAASRASGVALVDLVRWFFFVAEAVNVVLLLIIAARFLDVVRPSRILLFGIALNPIAWFLVCQHANFDVLVATAIIAFVLALLQFHRSKDPADWLVASFLLGIGILVKTIPFVLIPLLAFRMPALPSRVRAFGAVLLVTPAAIGMSVVYVLSPRQVIEQVLRYRSLEGWFGVTGLLHLARLESLSSLYARLFPLFVLIAMAIAAVRLARARELPPRNVVLLTAMTLVAVIAFGPGYGTQYIAWPLPFIVLSFALFDRQWSRDLIAVWVTAVLTLTFEYAFFYPQGAFMLAASDSAWVQRLSDIVSEPGLVTLIRLPLFASCLWFLAAARARIRAGL